MKKKISSIFLVAAISLGGCQVSDLPFMKKNHVTEDKDYQENSNKEKQTDKNNDKQDTRGKKDELTLPKAVFNSIKNEDGKRVIQNPANLLAVVNKKYSLPSNYAPSDLVRPNVDFSFGDSNEEKSHLRAKAAKALEEMFASAKSDGVELLAVSGYRSYARQSALFNAEINSVGEKKAEQAVAVPGTSEHQTGLAIDISSKSAGLILTQDFENTIEGKWLAENAHRFGFILRYPKGKEDITGYEYEPWHFRYVGKKYAKTMYENHYTLEEFFKVVKKI